MSTTISMDQARAEIRMHIETHGSADAEDVAKYILSQTREGRAELENGKVSDTQVHRILGTTFRSMRQSGELVYAPGHTRGTHVKAGDCAFEHVEEDASWNERLVAHMQNLSPFAFEKLVGKLLERSGIFDVQVTQRGSDGGVDGTGSAVNGPVKSPVVFQAKRYSGSVSAGAVRDFRGAMQGRAWTGFFLTTGKFTSSAIEEAERTQAVNIQLVDGPALATWLKDARLGVSVKERVVEDVEIDERWWSEFTE